MDRLTAALDERFRHIHSRSAALLEAIPEDRLYWRPREPPGAFPVYSCGEHLLRSAAAVEQTFGGITANLWDDPFEWTLPESLQTLESVLEYLEEVEATRVRGFSLLRADEDLGRMIAVPSGEFQPIFSLLVETLERAAHHQGRAFATFRVFSDARLPPL